MSGYLLDTHIVIWWLSRPERLPDDLRRTLLNPSQPVFVSAAAVWEIAIKAAVRRLQMPSNLVRTLTDNRVTLLPITADHALAVADLPLIHQDPFHRIQIVQAMQEDLTLVTADAHVREYQVRTWNI